MQTSYNRYAIYYLPDDPALAQFGASWLGHDVASGGPAVQPDVARIAQITRTPRKYGFHGTLKPPFHLANGRTQEGLEAAVADLADRLEPARAPGLRLARLGPFLALVPDGDATGISAIAEACVCDLDEFRAPPSAEELERRRAKGLNARQDDLLKTWGYPYVLDEFRFHLTLSGALAPEDLDHAEAALAAHLPSLPQPFEMASISLAGEQEDGTFVTLHRYPL